MFWSKNYMAQIATLIGLICLIGCAPAETEPPIDLGGLEPEETAVPTEDATESSGAGVYVDFLNIMILESFPVQVMVTVHGNLSNGCQVLDGITAERIGNEFQLEIMSHSEGDMCTAALVPFTEQVSLDVYGLDAGTYAVFAGNATAEFTLDVDNKLVDSEEVDGGYPEPSEPQPETQQITLFVDSQLVDCVGVAPQQCMRVRTSPDGEWEYFYDQIEGFTFEADREYELLVELIPVPYPPADGSSIRYLLVDIVKQNFVIDRDSLDIKIPQLAPTSVYIDGLEIVQSDGSNGRDIQARVYGNLPDGCARIDGITAERSGNQFRLFMATSRVGEACTMALVPFDELVPLDLSGLDDGTYEVVVNDFTALFELSGSDS